MQMLSITVCRSAAKGKTLNPCPLTALLSAKNSSIIYDYLTKSHHNKQECSHLVQIAWLSGQEFDCHSSEPGVTTTLLADPGTGTLISIPTLVLILVSPENGPSRATAIAAR
jgi:hypothetical protein